MTIYTNRNAAAIVGGTAAACGAIALLIRDAWSGGLTVDLCLMPLLVGLTILAGHLFGGALRNARVVSAAGLLALAIFGSGMTIYETAGRRAEIRDAKVAVATGAAEKRTHLSQMLAEAEQALATHRRTKDSECLSGRGKLCKAAEYTVSTWEHAVTGYETKLAQLPPPVPVDPRADRVAAIAGFFGATVDVPKIVAVIEPLLFPMFLELGSIILFGYGLGRPASSRSRVAAPAAITEREEPVTPQEIEDIRPFFVPMSRQQAEQDLVTMIALGTSIPSQQWLADRWKVAEGTVSKWVSLWETQGLAVRNRIGRVNAISEPLAA